MQMPADIAERLAVLGEDPARYGDMLYSEGAEFLRGFVKSLEDRDALFRTWWPKLSDFAAECRRRTLSLASESLSAQERAILSIYEAAIDNAERLPNRRGNEAIICCLPLSAIPVAQRLWPGADERCVLLTPEECRQWREIYQHADESFWWFINYWWNIEDRPDAKEWGRESGWGLSAGEEPWLVVSGLAWGSLAGGEDIDLWAWNGSQARFIERVGCTSF